MRGGRFAERTEVGNLWAGTARFSPRRQLRKILLLAVLTRGNATDDGDEFVDLV